MNSADPASRHPVAVLGAGAAAPSLRLAAADVGVAWGAGGAKGTVAVCDADEDTLTLAWQAALDALDAAGVDASGGVGAVVGHGPPPFAEGPSHAFLATALGLGRHRSRAPCAAGRPTPAWRLWSARGTPWPPATPAGPGRRVRRPGARAGHRRRGIDGRRRGGARPRRPARRPRPVPRAAAAVRRRPPDLTNGSSAPARLVARATRVTAAVDRYRADGAAATGDVYDGRLFREEVFVPLLARAGAAVAPPGGTPVDGVGGGGPRRQARRRRGQAPGGAARSARSPAGTVGDTGAAAPLLGILSAWAAGPESGVATLGMIGYGGGRATAVVTEVLRPVPGAARAAARLQGGRRVTYVEAVQGPQPAEPMSDPIPMGVPPGRRGLRAGQRRDAALEGRPLPELRARSRRRPRSTPRCTGCGGGRARRRRTWPAPGGCTPSWSTRRCRRRSRRRCPWSWSTSTTAPASWCRAPRPTPTTLAIDDAVTLALRRYAARAGRARLRVQGAARRAGHDAAAAAAGSAPARRAGDELEQGGRRRRRPDQVRRAVRTELRADGGGRLRRRAGQRRQGLRPLRHRRRHRGHPARHAVGSGGHRRQHRPERPRACRGSRARGWRTPVPRAPTPSASGPWWWRAASTTSCSSSASRRCATSRPRRASWPAPRPAIRSTTAGETAPVLFAPFATRHMHEFGTTPEMLASVAVKNHHNGCLDPYAHFQNEITVDQVLASPAVCQPAAAARLLPPDRRRRRRHPHHRRARRGVHRQARVRGRVRRGHRPPVPAREVHLRGPARHHGGRRARLRHGRRGTRGHGHGRGPRLLHHHRDPRHRGPRVRGEGQGRTGLARGSRRPSTAASP